MAEQKTEKATQRKVLKAREGGQFLVSRPFISALQFLTFLALLHSQAHDWFQTFRQAFAGFVQHEMDPRIEPRDLLLAAFSLMRITLLPVVGMGGILIVIGVGMQLMVTKFGFSGKSLLPDLNRLNPLTKLKQLPRQNLPALLQACVMIPVFAATLYYLVFRNIEIYLTLPLQNLAIGVAQVIGSVESLLWKAGGLFLVFGVVDLIRASSRYSGDLKMSKQEVRDEMKDIEGNPLMKGRMRRLRRTLARRNMMKEVPTATAVIVNPTHYAVVLKYDRETSGAPRVVAKGKNYLALRIRQKALDSGVPLIENPPLAQSLYKAVDVGHEIPVELYRAVAEILAYIYRITNGRRNAW